MINCEATVLIFQANYINQPIYFINPFCAHFLLQRFSIPVLAPPRSAYFACLSLLTHLIQIISLLEVRSVHELCSD